MDTESDGWVMAGSSAEGTGDTWTDDNGGTNKDLGFISTEGPAAEVVSLLRAADATLNAATSAGRAVHGAGPQGAQPGPPAASARPRASRRRGRVAPPPTSWVARLSLAEALAVAAVSVLSLQAVMLWNAVGAQRLELRDLRAELARVDVAVSCAHSSMSILEDSTREARRARLVHTVREALAFVGGAFVGTSGALSSAGVATCSAGACQ